MTSLTLCENRQTASELLALLNDPWWRLEHLYHIVDKQGKLVRFTLLPEQREFLLNSHLRDLILKARQLGFSTVIDLWMLDRAIFSPHLNCGIVAQDIKSAGEIFRTKIETPLDNLPDWLKPAVQITRRQGGSNGGRVEFSHGSSITVGTSFRSGTIHILHVSEHGKICARYADKARELRTGTLPAVPDDGKIFIESTAEGIGGDFYHMCMAAQSLSAAGLALTPPDFRFHFFAWWQNSSYAMPPPGSGLTLSDSEQKYFAEVEKTAQITLSEEQKSWYLHKKRLLGSEMAQEYPSVPSEAFLTSGRRVFPADYTLAAAGGLQTPLIIYQAEPLSGRRSKIPPPGDLSQPQTLQNYLLVWELPDTDEDYCIGADVAEGLEHGDFSSLDVVKKSTGEQVAHWYGHLDASLFASLLVHTGRWYNNAYLIPERNNHGHAVLAYLRDHYPLSRIHTEQYLDRDRENETPRLGWLTTRHSKPVLSEGLKDLLRENKSGIRWRGTLNELESYIYHPSGSMGAQAGCHDDQAMSYMLAQEGRARMPQRIKHPPQPYKARHWMNY